MPVAGTTTATKTDTSELLMHGTAWLRDGSGMTITDPTQAKRLRRAELSASTSFQLDPGSCAVSMVASRLLPRDDDAFEQNQLGTAAHGILEHVLSLPGAERTREAATATAERLTQDAVFAATLFDKDLVAQIVAFDEPTRQRWLAESLRRAHGLWDIENPSNVAVHANEMAFGKRFNRSVNIGKVPFVGFIDRVDRILDPAGNTVGYRVVDYKAGKYKDGSGRFGDDYGDQIRIYTIAVAADGGITPDSGSLYFITYGKERGIDVSPEAVEITVKRFERAWARMHKLADDNFYPAKAGPLCGWCELVNVCPTAKAAGKNADLSNTEKNSDGKRVIAVDENGVAKKAKGLKASQLGIDTVDVPAPSTPADPVGETQPDAPRVQPVNETVTPKTAEPKAAPATAPVAAHRDSTTGRNTMTETTAPKVKEGTNPREATIEDALNGNSYSASAVFGLSALAVEVLSKHNQPVTGSTVRALARTFAHVVQTVQFKLAGTASWQDGLNTRLRGALRTSVDTLPAPWGGDTEAWSAWATSVTNRTSAISAVALDLWSLGNNLPDAPWAALAGDLNAPTA